MMVLRGDRAQAAVDKGKEGFEMAMLLEGISVLFLAEFEEAMAVLRTE